jgi:hypothetical protein
VKVADFPADLNKDMIIGYTWSKTDYPTVYFTSGHYTQKHAERWNLGWDSYEGWECKFFGNVPILKKPPPNDKAPDSSTDAQGQAIPIADYVRNLKSLGKTGLREGTLEIRTTEFWTRPSIRNPAPINTATPRVLDSKYWPTFERPICPPI